MPKPKKALTDDEKFELQLQTEQELGRLQRQYKILEKNPLGFSETSRTLVKQQRVLNLLKKEQSNIFADLSVASASGKVRADIKVLNHLETLLDEYDKFDSSIKTKTAHLKEIAIQSQKVQKDVICLSAQQITDQKYQERVLTGRKTVEQLENKLDVQIKQFCTICSDNTKLRQDIGHLLIERAEFNKIWERLISNLNTGKRFMLDLIEQATIAYDQREEWVSKLQFLRNKAYTDLNMHITDMREVQRKIDNNNKLQEFILTKGQKRIMKDLGAKEYRKRMEQREEMNKILSEYQQILANVKEFTGEEAIDVIARNFLLQEQENFSLFEYVNDLNKEMEGLNDSLVDLHFEIDREKALDNMRGSQQQSTLERLKGELVSATGKASAEETELKQLEAKIKTIMNGVERLFQQFKCSRDPLIELLGHNEQINYYNVMLYLEILEKNILRYMVDVYYREKTMVESKKMNANQMLIPTHSGVPQIYTMDQIVSTNPCPLCVEHEYVSDVIDVLQYVLNKDQVQEKLRERLQLEDGLDRLHNVSACHLPKSREIIQKRYQ